MVIINFPSCIIPCTNATAQSSQIILVVIIDVTVTITNIYPTEISCSTIFTIRVMWVISSHVVPCCSWWRIATERAVLSKHDTAKPLYIFSNFIVRINIDSITIYRGFVIRNVSGCKRTVCVTCA